jgi:hypothetical protein
MDESRRGHPFDLLRRVIHLIERTGATIFLLVAIYCGLIEATAFTATVTTHALRFARERTHEAARAVSGLVSEVKEWRR